MRQRDAIRLLSGVVLSSEEFERLVADERRNQPANPCCFYMARGPQSLRGNVNAVLNGLVTEGIITSFDTNFDGISALGILHIAVTADLITDPRIPGYERPKVMAIRNRVTKELEGAGAADVMVSVRSSRL